MPCRFYLFYFPLYSLRYRSWWLCTGQNKFYRIFTSFAIKFCFSFSSTGLPVAATVDTLTITTPSTPASNIGVQLGNYTNDILDDIGVDYMYLFIAKDWDALSPDLSSVVHPSNLFSTPIPTSDTTRVTSSTPNMECVCLFAILVYWQHIWGR